MKYLLLFLLAALAVGGCESSTPPPAELTRSMTLTVHWASREEMNAAAAVNGDAAIDRDGYTVLQGGARGWTCDVYVRKPLTLGTATQTLLGHELLHCIYGAWHR